MLKVYWIVVLCMIACGVYAILTTPDPRPETRTPAPCMLHDAGAYGPTCSADRRVRRAAGAERCCC